jgi:SAM-dependent methyltransferase
MSDEFLANRLRAGREWERLGPETKAVLCGLLPPEWSFSGKRVLDFGCGTGRTLRQFRTEAREADFWGVDINSTGIERVRQELCPPMHAQVCGEAPPLGLEYGTFDLIWAISVFTHLPDQATAWLVELHRLLKPSGLLIATYMGRHHSEFTAGEPWDEDRIGRNVLLHNRPWEESGPMVLMSDWWTREHWGRAFEVVDVIEAHFQSWPVLSKRDVEVTVDEIDRPSDDPREHLAIRHNLRQAQREIEATQGMCAAAIKNIRREEEARLLELQRAYETSLSWRLTGPLRTARRAAGSLRARLARRGAQPTCR